MYMVLRDCFVGQMTLSLQGNELKLGPCSVEFGVQVGGWGDTQSCSLPYEGCGGPSLQQHSWLPASVIGWPVRDAVLRSSAVLGRAG